MEPKDSFFRHVNNVEELVKMLDFKNSLNHKNEKTIGLWTVCLRIKLIYMYNPVVVPVVFRWATLILHSQYFDNKVWTRLYLLCNN